MVRTLSLGSLTQHASFWFCAAAGLLAGTVWYLAARNTPEEHPWVRSQELDSIVGGRGDAQIQNATSYLRSDARPGTPWKRICCSKEVLGLTASYFTYGYVAWIYFSWFYIYLNQVRGLNLKSSSYYSMLPFIAMATASPDRTPCARSRAAMRFARRSSSP